MWNVGERRWSDFVTPLWLITVTKHWLCYLGSGHFVSKLPGTWWLWCGGVLSQSCLHKLTNVIISRMNISLSNDGQSEVYLKMQIQSVCFGACVGTCFVPGVWKLMRLISTGSVGWWAIISALLNRLLVPGSESLRLLLKREWVKRAISTCKQPERENQTQCCHTISTATWIE